MKENENQRISPAGKHGIEAFCKFLIQTPAIFSLTILNLPHNDMTDEGFEAIGLILKQNVLVSLNISSNIFGFIKGNKRINFNLFFFQYLIQKRSYMTQFLSTILLLRPFD